MESLQTFRLWAWIFQKHWRIQTANLEQVCVSELVLHLVENIIFHQRFLTFAWKLGGWTKPFSCSCAKSLRLTPWKCDLWQLGRDVCTGLFVPASRMGSGKHVEVRPSLAWTILRRCSALFHPFWARCANVPQGHLCAICPGCHSKFETP